MRKKLLILLLAGMFSLTACGQNTTEEPKDNPIEEEQDDSNGSGGEEETGEEQDPETDVDEDDSADNDQEEQDSNTQSESISITIYSSNEDATAFVSEEVRISTLSPEAVLKALVDKEIVPIDIEVRSFHTTTVDGKASIEIDFNSAFASYIMSMGSTGEYYTMGSICNTFLNAYDCEQIKITVEGAVLESGHKDYPGYMASFS